MAPTTAGPWLLLLALWTSSTVGSIVQKAADDKSTECAIPPKLQDVSPTDCCRSFLEVHKAIIECLPKPGGTGGTSCIVGCLLLNHRAQKLLNSMPVPMSSIITVGPKLAAHFQQCQSNLHDFIVGNPFEGDFQRVVCDDRLNGFFLCMVRNWLEDCIGFDNNRSECVEMQTFAKSSNCSVASLFARSSGL